MIATWLLQTFAWILAFAVLLFVPAGTLHWPAAWVFLIFMVASGIGFGGWLAKRSPELLAERMRAPIRTDQPKADKAFLAVFLVVNVAWLVLIGLDERFRLSGMPVGLQAFGLLLLIASSAFIAWVFAENSFAAAVVRVQSERGHHVISTGPYAFVRHPMYSGAVLYFAAIALQLGSWWGLVLSPVFFALFSVRADLEERELAHGLPGYAGYLTRVRYRLVPGLW